jgi:hypothetical protein
MIIEFKFDTTTKEGTLMQDGSPMPFYSLECYYDEYDKKHRLTVCDRKEDKDNGLYVHTCTYASCNDGVQKFIQEKLGMK